MTKHTAIAIAMEPSALQMTLLSMERMTKNMTYTYLKLCVIKTKECNLFGMLYTLDGVKPSPDNGRAIEGMETPKDKRELHTFLGMATYMSSIIPKPADPTAPLRDLLKGRVDFAWNPSHSKDYQKVKSMICTAITLAYNDRNESVVLHVNA